MRPPSTHCVVHCVRAPPRRCHRAAESVQSAASDAHFDGRFQPARWHGRGSNVGICDNGSDPGTAGRLHLSKEDD